MNQNQEQSPQQLLAQQLKDQPKQPILGVAGVPYPHSAIQHDYWFQSQQNIQNNNRQSEDLLLKSINNAQTPISNKQLLSSSGATQRNQGLSEGVAGISQSISPKSNWTPSTIHQNSCSQYSTTERTFQSSTRNQLESSKIARAIAQNALNQVTAKRAFYNLSVGVIQEESSFLASAYQDCLSQRQKQLMTLAVPNFEGLMPISKKCFNFGPKRKIGTPYYSQRGPSPQGSIRGNTSSYSTIYGNNHSLYRGGGGGGGGARTNSISQANSSPKMRVASVENSIKRKKNSVFAVSSSARNDQLIQNNALSYKKRLQPPLKYQDLQSNYNTFGSPVKAGDKHQHMQQQKQDKKSWFSKTSNQFNRVGHHQTHNEFSKTQHGFNNNLQNNNNNQEIDQLQFQQTFGNKKLSYPLQGSLAGSDQTGTFVKNRNSLVDNNNTIGQPHQLNQNRIGSGGGGGGGDGKRNSEQKSEKQAFINRLTTQKALGKKKLSTNSEYSNRVSQGGGGVGRDVFNALNSGINDKGIGIKHQPGQKKQRDFVIRKTNLHH